MNGTAPPLNISIHALREEGDLCGPPAPSHSENFYPRPPRGGRRHWHMGQSRTRQFLSTPSARRATEGIAIDAASLTLFLSTPSARRATQRGFFSRPRLGFLSTPSARRATYAGYHPPCNNLLSIHALREEGDVRRISPPMQQSAFYPRPP